MFLRQTRRKKDGKTHVYWNVVENRRLDDGRVVQRQVLYLGEIHPSQAAAWRQAIEVFDEASGEPRTLALFPEDRCEAVADDASVVRVCLSALSLRRPRQWGGCWLSGQLWRELQMDWFWSERLPPSRKGTRWDQILQVLGLSADRPGQRVEAAPRVVRQQRHGRPARRRFWPGRGAQAVRLSRPAAGPQGRVVLASGRALARPVQR